MDNSLMVEAVVAGWRLWSLMVELVGGCGRWWWSSLEAVVAGGGGCGRWLELVGGCGRWMELVGARLRVVEVEES
ncbi:unnamed protein product [Ilex paraguariensis]|uniref:Transmembrane protein n=1 Tax=Ilex paraguariensis TaxID=185542 RepID=A0ABC8SBN8_9AQUA